MATAALLPPGRGKQGGRRVLTGLAEVVDSRAADVDRGEVLLHPCRDHLPRSRLAVRRTSAVAADEVPHLMVGDIGLELRERRGVVRTAESADRHDRCARLELESAHRE